jgi:hypothetical protein
LDQARTNSQAAAQRNDAGWLLAGLVLLSAALGLGAVATTFALRSSPSDVQGTQRSRWRLARLILALGAAAGAAMAVIVGVGAFAQWNKITVPLLSSTAPSSAANNSSGLNGVKVLDCDLVGPGGQAQASSSPTLSFSLDEGSACVNGRTSYARTPNGYARYIVVAARSSVVRNTISTDLSSFTQEEFSLSAADYASWKAAAEQEGSCGASPGSGSTGFDGLAANLPEPPTITKRWACHVDAR